jgi:hypothetical protein
MITPAISCRSNTQIFSSFFDFGFWIRRHDDAILAEEPFLAQVLLYQLSIYTS